MLEQSEFDMLTPEERAYYDNASRAEQISFVVDWRSRKGGGPLSDPKTTTAQDSTMRTLGAAASVVFGFLGLGLTYFGMNTDTLLPAIICFCLFGYFSAMWMMGAIEKRLIDINQTLKNR